MLLGLNNLLLQERCRKKSSGIGPGIVNERTKYTHILSDAQQIILFLLFSAIGRSFPENLPAYISFAHKQYLKVTVTSFLPCWWQRTPDSFHVYFEMAKPIDAIV